jgi:molecular chaperone GrpE (heat shock protein)
MEMDALRRMHELQGEAAAWMEKYEESERENAYYRGRAEQALAQAAIYATMATAEALARIAHSLESLDRSGITVYRAEL